MDSGIYSRKRRRREVNACQTCRRRKLKCDHQNPCSRCRSTNLSETCTYDYAVSDDVERSIVTHVASVASAAPAETTPSTAEILRAQSARPLYAISPLDPAVANSSQDKRVLDLEAKVGRLERLVMLQNTTPGSASSGPQDTAITTFDLTKADYPDKQKPDLGERMFFKGKGLRTEFYGASNPWSLISHLSLAIKDFFKDAHTTSIALARLSSAAEAINTRIDAEEEPLANVITSSDLVWLLPSRQDLDEMVDLYWKSFGLTYRVLHWPTFVQEYDRFWQEPTARDPKFMIILLLCAASVRCIKKEPALMQGTDSVASELAARWIDACEVWIFHNMRTPSGLTDLQIRCLLIIAREATFVRTRYEWSEAGSLLLLGISAGLHRESSLLFHKPSVFEQEMRRRIWAVIANHELTASMTRGVSPISSIISHDCKSPANLQDDSFGPDTQEGIGSGDDQRYTGVSFLYWSQQSFNLRARITGMINSGDGFSYGDALTNHEEITAQLNAMPQWFHDSDVTSESSLPRAMLEVQLRRLSMLLHYPFIGKHEYSKFVCYGSACSLISRYWEFETVGNHALSVMERDMLRAALCITNLAHDLTGLSLYAPLPGLLLERALSFFEGKVIRSGHGLRSYWFICALCSIKEIAPSTTPTKDVRMEIIDKLISLYSKCLSLQTDRYRPPLEQQGTLPLQTNGDPVPGNYVEQPAIAGSYDTSLLDVTDPFFGAYEMPEWTLDFNNFDFNSM